MNINWLKSKYKNTYNTYKLTNIKVKKQMTGTDAADFAILDLLYKLQC